LKLHCWVSKFIDHDFLDQLARAIIASGAIDLVKFLIGIAIGFLAQAMTTAINVIELAKFLMGVAMALL